MSNFGDNDFLLNPNNNPSNAGDRTEPLSAELKDGEVLEEPDQKESDSNEEDSDVQSMLRELDPMKRHVKQLRIKLKEMDAKRLKPLPKLTENKRGALGPTD